MGVLMEQVRIHAIRGDQAQAQTAIAQAMLEFPPGSDQQFRDTVRKGLEMIVCAAAYDAAGYLNLAKQVPNFPHFERAFLEGKYADAADAVDQKSPDQAVVQHGLLFLAAQKTKDQKLADGQWQQLLQALEKDDRHSRRLAAMLAGREPLNADLIARLPINPKEKRVLLAVVARRHPEQAKGLLSLAMTLDFFHDGTSLCLRKVID
jgi:hypothetical protein